MNIKFPKEESIIAEQIKQAIITNNHQLLLKLYDEVIKHGLFLNKYNKKTVRIVIFIHNRIKRQRFGKRQTRES